MTLSSRLCLVSLVACFLTYITYSNASSCSISVFTRRRCAAGVITDKDSCISAGCCYDGRAGVPSSGKCYKKGGSLQLGGRGFNPTMAPNLGGILEVGGEPGFPGSRLTLSCSNQFCPASGYYPADARVDCVRKGCCWKNGKCYRNTVRILSLRSRCPPGYANPPKCTVVNPCDNNPCLNGGVCTFTGPGKFSCACPQKFSGATCTPNCVVPTIPKVSVLAMPNGYQHLQYITVQCNLGTKWFSGTVLRQCLNGAIVPSFATEKVVCESECSIAALPAGTKIIAPLSVTKISSKETVTYACKSSFLVDPTSVMTRTCTDGKLIPSFQDKPIVCNAGKPKVL